MFFGEDVFKKVGSLSGGERSRLKLAMLMYDDLNLLILDEPTNHLDIDSREELEIFLKNFEGTLLFVSHDRYFINNLASRVVELAKGSLVSYEGNYEYYKEKCEELKKSLVKKPSNNSDVLKKKSKSKDLNKNNNTNKNNNSDRSINKWKVAKLESEIEKLEESLNNIEEEINKFSNDYEKVNELYNEKLRIENELEKLMEEYFKFTS